MYLENVNVKIILPKEAVEKIRTETGLEIQSLRVPTIEGKTGTADSARLENFKIIG